MRCVSWLLVLGLAGCVGASAHGQGGPQAPGHDLASKQEKQLGVFLLDMSEGGIVEVQFGQLAAEKASDPQVKAYAQEMVDDHTKLNATLKKFVVAHKLFPPDGLNTMNQQEYDKLKGLTGEDFDREYLTVLVAGQHNELHQYRRQAAITTDPELKAALADAVRMIFEYTRQMDAIAGMHGVALPEHPPVPNAAAPNTAMPLTAAPRQ